MDMNLTYGNTVIVLGDNPIPLKQLKLAQQVLIFEKDQSLEDTGEERYTNKIKNMVLSSIEGESLYTFSCMDVMPSVNICENTPDNENDPITFYIEDASMENDKEYQEGYLVCEDKILKIKTDRWIYDTYEDDINAKEEDEEEDRKYIDTKKDIIKGIFNKMMIEYDNKFSWSLTDDIKEENKTFAYFYKPLNNDAALVLMKIHTINPDIRYWSVNEYAFLVLRNGKILNINDKFDNILNFIPDYKYLNGESELDKFKKICSFDEYDINDYFKNPAKIQEINEFFKFNNMIWNKYQSIEEFFKPVFKMGEYTSYITLPTQVHDDCLSHFKNGKYVNSYSDEAQDPDFKKYSQIAYQTKQFIKARNSGLNPADGMIYKNGKHDDQSAITYADAELIEIQDGYNNSKYYGLYKGYFRLLDKHIEEDIELIREGIDRRKVMSKLSGVII